MVNVSPLRPSKQAPKPVDDFEFGFLLKSFRERRGISQSKLAERAEFDHSYVSRLESHARKPTRDAVDRLAEAMELGESERDMLLAAAGFLPRDFNKIITAQPTLGMAFYLMEDENLPQEFKDPIISVIENMHAAAQLFRAATPLVSVA